MNRKTIVSLCMFALVLHSYHLKAAESQSGYTKVSALTRNSDGSSEHMHLSNRVTPEEVIFGRTTTSYHSSDAPICVTKEAVIKSKNTGTIKSIKKVGNSLTTEENDPWTFAILSNWYHQMLNTQNNAATSTLAVLQNQPLPTITQTEEKGTPRWSFSVDDVTTLMAPGKYKQEKKDMHDSTITWNINNDELIQKLAALLPADQKDNPTPLVAPDEYEQNLIDADLIEQLFALIPKKQE